jgi:signal transduction histidine kinase/ligand-binding sensor domain-containing protein
MIRNRILLLIAFCALVLGVPTAALNPLMDLAQYKMTTWGIDDGAPQGVQLITQSKDGYLWLGGSSGLHRFDGLNFEPVAPPSPAPDLPNVTSLLSGREGDFWVGYRSGQIAVRRAGVLRYAPFRAQHPVLSLAQLPSGDIWAAIARERDQLAVNRNGRWKSVGSGWGLPEGQPWMILGGRNGILWVSVRNSIYLLRDGARRFERGAELSSASALSEDASGNVWVSNAEGSWAIADRSGRILPTPKHRYPTLPTKRKKFAIFDRAGSLWGLGGRGVLRIAQPRIDGEASTSSAIARIATSDIRLPLSSYKISHLFEDREGSIWLASGTHLIRLRETNVVRELDLTNFAKWGDPLLGASDGNVYIGEADGVYRVGSGAKPARFLAGHEPQAICEGVDGTIWTVLQDRVVGINAGRKTTLPSFGTTKMGIADCAVDTDGQLWLAGLLEGLFRWNGERWERMLVPAGDDGLPPSTLLRTRSHGLIVGFSNGGLGTLSGSGQLTLLIGRNNSFGQVRTVFDARESLLLGGSNGLMLLKDGKLQLLGSKRFPVLQAVSGIAQTPSGETWLRTAAGIVRVDGKDLRRGFEDPEHRPHFELLDFRDGLPGLPSSDVGRDAVRGGDGRIWFGSTGGIVWVDPARLSHNALAPLVSIGSLTTADALYRDPLRLDLAAGVSSVAISFAALSIAIPERVKVRYKLEGEDTGWIDPGSRRQAFYTNLKPGSYVFRVIAANDDGVWNRTGATLHFTIAPTFRQSIWFVLLCMLAVALTLRWAYRLRLAQLTARMQARLEERERIARDLHDTLLQGFQGLVLRFQSIADEIPLSFPARNQLNDALDSADEVLEDGRISVAQLRREAVPDLRQALMDTAERMRADYPIEFRMTVEGAPRDLHPVVRTELRRIGDEAVINAFQHSRAQTIEIVISYHASALLMGVRDDGIGMSADLISGLGRQGHFGLVGMRERASAIQADLKMTSRALSGTEIHVRVPGRIAYNLGRRTRLDALAAWAFPKWRLNR